MLISSSYHCTVPGQVLTATQMTPQLLHGIPGSQLLLLIHPPATRFALEITALVTPLGTFKTFKHYSGLRLKNQIL